jgi:hypothetical protein
MDRGIPTEAHLALMRERGAQYLVGTPKGRLNRLEAELAACSWQQAREQVQVKLLAQDDELYVYVKSQRRVHKERAMRQQRLRRYLARLHALKQQRPRYDTLLTKLGAAQALAGRAASLVTLRLPEAPDKQARRQRTDFDFHLDRARLRRVRKRKGRYLLRSNLTATDPAQLWQFYVQLVEVEAAFKNQKRTGHSADLPSTRGSHRGAHLCVLGNRSLRYPTSCIPAVVPRLLRAGHTESPTQTASPRTHRPAGTRQTRRHPDAGCALPHNRRARTHLHPLH